MERVHRGVSAVDTGAEPVTRMGWHRRLIVMVRVFNVMLRLDRIIALRELALTDVVPPMLRPSRTMTRAGWCHTARLANEALTPSW
jgi:hypothetical protein